MAPRRLGGTAEGPRDQVVPLRLRTDEMDEVKAFAAEDDWEHSSWLYLRFQEVLAAERRKRHRHRSTPDT
jgi:hypothetical protein